ncbi:Fanconi anemia group D2 protein [Dissophora globulifera]|uniref:Fanconi anemia group D2 protein n=1 Tax=Dissophora globulifera TaxID=979702 RepID=A0A9P6RSZ1_9FUNG|nr:Fanconi anemia group D2 protein [Dissophora globulifera]
MTLIVGTAAFSSICQQSGLTLGANGTPNILQADPSRFQRDVGRLISRTPSHVDCIESFLEGLQEHIEDPNHLKSCLQPISPSYDKGLSFSLNESLIRILLGIDALQPGLLAVLLDRLLAVMSDDEQDSPMPKLILQQLKWLNNIVEPEQLSAKLLEANARNHVLDKLASAELDELPVVIKFLLQTVEPNTVEDVIEAIRSNLDFGSINRLQKNLSKGSKKRASNQTPEVLIVDALKTGIRFQKFVTDAWYKAIVSISKAVRACGHRIIDVMVMLVLHSNVSFKKKVESMIRKKIIEGQLTRKLLQETVLVHGVSLREYMPAILSIAENLLRSSANYPIVVRMASVLYTSAFQVSDAYYRQEIVASLLVHIGSGSPVEIDASMAVLQDIVHVSRSALNEYSAFIKGVLDYLGNLSLEQIRLLFVVLGSLAREDEVSGNAGSLLTELNIIIRKQLSNPMERYKKIGVMGAIAMVQAFGVNETGGNSGQGSSSQMVNHRQAEFHPLLKTSVLYLRMIKDASQKSTHCLALTYDELASMVSSGDLDPGLVLWIKEEFSNQFAETFVCGANEVFTMRPTRNIAMERWMNLDGPESELSISIMPSLCADLTNSASQGTRIDTPDGSVYLCPLFKLLQATEKATGENDLDDIDGLLGCGITMFKHEYLEDIGDIYSTEVCHTVTQGLLTAVNWFREISNAFSYDAGDQTMARIIIRLQQMSQIEDMLRHILKSAPGFRPLEASHPKAQDLSKGVHTVNNAFSIQSTNPNVLGHTSVGSMDIESAPKPFAPQSSELVSYESLTPYLRELELDIFHVLRVHKPITREVFEIAELDQNKRVQLLYPQLLFLLKDLHAKIVFKLPAPAVHSPFAKKLSSAAANNALLARMSAADFVRGVLKIVPHVVAKIRMILQVLHDEKEAIIQDGEPVDKAIVSECLSISLKVLLALLSWNELRGSDQKELRLEMLKSLAIDEKTSQQILEIQSSINLSAVAVEAFNSLSKWHDVMPKFESSAMFLEVLDKVLDLVPRIPDTSLKASAVATKILSHDWPSSLNVKPEHLAYVLGQQIGRSNVRLQMISEYVTEVLPSFLDQDEAKSSLHPMLTTSTFTVLHMQLSTLVGEFSEEHFSNTQAALDHISSLCQCFQKLAAFVKSNDKREVLGVTLKHSKVFMEQFIKRVLPFLGTHFRGHQDTVAKIFKSTLQPATRSLQNVCGHAKASRDQSLMVMVPSIRKTMESLIFEVKLMLENNDAGAAFWLGNLKHRNLRGEEISSQLPVASDEEDREDHEEDLNGNSDNGTDQDDIGISSKKSTSKKRSRAGTTPHKAAGTSAEGASKKVQREKKKRPRVKTTRSTAEDDEARIHTKSDMSDDEHDQLAGDDGDDPPLLPAGSRKRGRSLVKESESEDTDHGETDRYADSMVEKQDERAERRRRIRNPYIDDAAMEGDSEEEEEDEEEEDDDDNDDEEEEEDGDEADQGESGDEEEI